jgi:hypothetical protein
VLGGVVVAPGASELILAVSVAVEKRLMVEDLARTFAVCRSLSASITGAARKLVRKLKEFTRTPLKIKTFSSERAGVRARGIGSGLPVGSGPWRRAPRSPAQSLPGRTRPARSPTRRCWVKAGFGC